MTNVQTTDFIDKLDELTDDEIEVLSEMEGKNRHVSRAISRKHGYTWTQVQALRKRYLASISNGKGD